MGIVQSDPNPANFSFNIGKNILNLFDFGATHIYKQSFLVDYFNIISGAVQGNETSIY